jgi:hypothetical protein
MSGIRKNFEGDQNNFGEERGKVVVGQTRRKGM